MTVHTVPSKDAAGALLPLSEAASVLQQMLSSVGNRVCGVLVMPAVESGYLKCHRVSMGGQTNIWSEEVQQSVGRSFQS